ncbi:thiamine phosphate synthase [Candidatus Pelagibacter sp.]|nr:thiamine phosphate synthase [Candidatus Pelagibacter sp.]
MGFPNKYYFINEFDTKNIYKLDKNTGIIFRNYNSKINLKSIISLNNFCKKKGYKFFLANNIKLALKLKLDGAYIPSFNKDTKHLSFSLTKNFIILGSAHNNKEIKIKEKQSVKVIFLSSIFKKNKNYLGINKFKLLAKLTKTKIVALGGISVENLKKLKLTNCFGFAGISFYKQKKGP